jgi:hypothetical protein
MADARCCGVKSRTCVPPCLPPVALASSGHRGQRARRTRQRQRGASSQRRGHTPRTQIDTAAMHATLCTRPSLPRPSARCRTRALLCGHLGRDAAGQSRAEQSRAEQKQNRAKGGSARTTEWERICAHLMRLCLRRSVVPFLSLPPVRMRWLFTVTRAQHSAAAFSKLTSSTPTSHDTTQCPAVPPANGFDACHLQCICCRAPRRSRGPVEQSEGGSDWAGRATKAAEEDGNGSRERILRG